MNSVNFFLHFVYNPSGLFETQIMYIPGHYFSGWKFSYKKKLEILISQSAQYCCQARCILTKTAEFKTARVSVGVVN